MRKTAGIIAALALASSALFAGTAAEAAGPSLAAGGSSFSGGMFTTCANNFKDAPVNTTGATVTYTASSSGTGRGNFVANTFDFAGSDGAFGSADKKPAGEFAYIPVLGGPIAIIFNVPGVNALKLDAATVGAIFKGQIKTWNDPAIKKLNKKATLPATAITPMYRNSKSGTNENFSGYLAANGASGWTKNQDWAAATGDTTPAGTGATASSGVVGNVKANENSIGYVDLKDALSSRLKYASLKNAAGQFVKPTTSGSAKFLSGQSIGADGFVTLDWAKKIKGGYNASLITYAIVNTGAASKNGTAVKDFINYTLKTCVPANATKLGYVSLTGAISAKAKALAATIK